MDCVCVHARRTQRESEDKTAWVCVGACDRRQARQVTGLRGSEVPRLTPLFPVCQGEQITLPQPPDTLCCECTFLRGFFVGGGVCVYLSVCRVHTVCVAGSCWRVRRSIHPICNLQSSLYFLDQVVKSEGNFFFHFHQCHYWQLRRIFNINMGLRYNSGKLCVYVCLPGFVSSFPVFVISYILWEFFTKTSFRALKYEPSGTHSGLPRPPTPSCLFKIVVLFLLRLFFRYCSSCFWFLILSTLPVSP